MKNMASFCHKDILRSNHVQLVNELNLHLFLDLLEPSLGKTSVGVIQEQPTSREKTRKLLDTLSRAPVEKFDYFCKTIAGLYPSLFKLLKGCEPRKEEADFYLQSFTCELRQSVLTAGNKPDNEIDEPINLDTQFVNLTLNKVFQSGDNVLPAAYQRDLEERRGKDVDVNDILLTDSSGSATLIKGRAGVGKSTLIQYLMRQWAKGKWEPSKTCAFLLNLRKLVHIHRDVTFKELLGLYAEYVVETPDIRLLVLEWLKNNAENVMFFIDGIDELPHLTGLLKRTPRLLLNEETKARPLDWCLNLMQKNLLQGSTRVLISRPFDDLYQLRCERIIDVCGLTQEKMMLFIEKNVSEARQEAVKEILLRDPVLASVCSITFYCAAVCKILEVDTTIKSNTLKTYSRITAYIIMRLAARKSSEEATTSLMSDSLRRCLPYLGALAYTGLLETDPENELTRLVFSEEDIRNTRISPENMNEAHKTGLLTYGKLQDPLSPEHNKLQAQFIHLSVQEFLAVSKMAVDAADCDEEKIRLFEAERIKLSDIFAFGVVFDKDDQNIADIRNAMTQNQKPASPEGKTIEQYMLEAFEEICSDLVYESSYDRYGLLPCLQAAYESQRKDLAKLLGEYAVIDKELTVEEMQMTAVDMMALFFMLRETDVETLTLRVIPMDVASGKELADYLATTSTLCNLRLYGKITDDGMSHVCRGIKSSKSLNHLFLKCNMTDKGIGYLADAISSPTCLTHLHLRAMIITDKGMEYLGNSIGSPASTISHLNLEFFSMEEQDSLRYIFNGVKLSKSLKYLSLDSVIMGDELIRNLSDAIRCSTSIEGLAFDSVSGYTDIGIGFLYDAIQHAPSLQQLDLVRGRIKDEAMQRLSDMVRDAPNLKDLKLRVMPISDVGMTLLSAAFVSTSVLTTLLMEYNYLSDEGLRLLSEAVRASTALTHLKFVSWWISHKGSRFIADAIKASVGLQSVELCYNAYTNEGLAYLNNVISSSTNWVPLKIDSRKMTKEEVDNLRRELCVLKVELNKKDVKHLRHKLTRSEVHVIRIC